MHPKEADNRSVTHVIGLANEALAEGALNSHTLFEWTKLIWK